MKKILLFPGQGYQSINMLTNEVQEYLIKNGLYEDLNKVLNNNSLIFDTEIAQPIVVGTQLAMSEQVKRYISNQDDIEYMGLSLGEITALIASGTLTINEGLKFVEKRGIESKKYSIEELDQKKFGVIRVPYTEKLESSVKDWNLKHESNLEKVSITNYMPATSGGQDVTITAEDNLLSDNILQFGGTPEQKRGKMQCPFHSSALERLSKTQMTFFDEIIKNIDYSKIASVFSTRTGKKYNTGDNISEALALYLIEPIQTTKSLQYAIDEKADVIVMMGELFTQTLKAQFQALGGNPERIKHCKEFIQERQKQSDNQPSH